VTVQRPITEVFEYFSRFETISEWDPNVRQSKLTKSTASHIDDQYELITVWKGT
jgi:hypothetical protein